MFRDMRPRSRALIAATTLGLIASPLALTTSASANPAGDGLVISEVYLNGGSAGATYTNKYVEIYNPTAAPINLTGMSVQYRSGTGTGSAARAIALTGTVAGGRLLRALRRHERRQRCRGPERRPDERINPGGGAGTLFLATGTAAINPTSTPASVVDLVGWGTTTASEGTSASRGQREHQPPAPEGRQRREQGHRRQQRRLLRAGAVPGHRLHAPAAGRSSSPARSPRSRAPTPRPRRTPVTSPPPRGVVTATYPTGGFNGFFLQTDGTGGATDATPGASDAIFVFGSAAMAANPVVGEYLQVVGTGQRVRRPHRDHAGRRWRDPPRWRVRPVVAQTSLPGSACALGSCPTASELPRPRGARERAPRADRPVRRHRTPTAPTQRLHRDRPGHRRQAAGRPDRGRGRPDRQRGRAHGVQQRPRDRPRRRRQPELHGGRQGHGDAVDHQGPRGPRRRRCRLHRQRRPRLPQQRLQAAADLAGHRPRCGHDHLRADPGRQRRPGERRR